MQKEFSNIEVREILKHLEDFLFLLVNRSFYTSVSKVQTCQSYSFTQTEKGGFEISEVFCVCVCICLSV